MTAVACTEQPCRRECRKHRKRARGRGRSGRLVSSFARVSTDLILTSLRFIELDDSLCPVCFSVDDLAAAGLREKRWHANQQVGGLGSSRWTARWARWWAGCLLDAPRRFASADLELRRRSPVPGGGRVVRRNPCALDRGDAGRRGLCVRRRGILRPRVAGTAVGSGSGGGCDRAARFPFGRSEFPESAGPESCDPACISREVVFAGHAVLTALLALLGLALRRGIASLAARRRPSTDGP